MNSYTPVDDSGANLPLTFGYANYESLSSDVNLLEIEVSYPPNPDTSVAKVSLPPGSSPSFFQPLAVGAVSGPNLIYAQALNGYLKFYAAPNTTTALTNAAMSGLTINVGGTYFTN